MKLERTGVPQAVSRITGASDPSRDPSPPTAAGRRLGTTTHLIVVLFFARQVPLVMTHGYGMAIGGWSVVLADLSASTHVFATDWLGWGLSSRPRWELKGSKESEAFFIDSLERWVRVPEFYVVPDWYLTSSGRERGCCANVPWLKCPFDSFFFLFAAHCSGRLRWCNDTLLHARLLRLLKQMRCLPSYVARRVPDGTV